MLFSFDYNRIIRITKLKRIEMKWKKATTTTAAAAAAAAAAVPEKRNEKTRSANKNMYTIFFCYLCASPTHKHTQYNKYLCLSYTHTFKHTNCII